jgi:hypothetical protein
MFPSDMLQAQFQAFGFSLKAAFGSSLLLGPVQVLR